LEDKLTQFQCHMEQSHGRLHLFACCYLSFHHTATPCIAEGKDSTYQLTGAGEGK
jgi:hypothetical protein